MRKRLTIIMVLMLLFTSLQPTWTKAEEEPELVDEVVYDIIIDRFNNGRQAPSNQVDVDNPYTYNGGDIQGITDMLDELQEYGFTAVSISPVMENAEGAFHGYLIEDFFAVEEEFGSLEDLQTLVEEAHNRGMKVFMELVVNYVAKSSPLTTDQDKQDWFKENTVEPVDATEWLHDVYVFDHEKEAVQDFLIDVAHYWLDEVELDGYVIHAADEASPEFLERLAKELKQTNPQMYLMATTLQNESSLDYLLEIEEFDAVANETLFHALNEVLSNPDQPISTLLDLTESMDAKRTLLFVDNKTSSRFSFQYAQNGRNMETVWKMALAYLYYTPGVPFILQGSEVPMYAPEYPDTQALVDFIVADPNLKKEYERLSFIREEFPALRQGDLERVGDNEGMSLFQRTLDNEEVYVAINNDSESRTVTFTGLDTDLQLKGLLHDDTIRANEDGEFLVGMPREEIEVFIVQPNTGFNWLFIGFVVGVFVLFAVIVIYLSQKEKQRKRSKSLS